VCVCVCKCVCVGVCVCVCVCVCLTCNGLQESAHVEDALLHDALEAHAEDGDEGHGAQQQDPGGEEDGGGLPEAAGDLAEVHGVRSAEDSAPQLRKTDAAAVDAQRGPVRLLGGPREAHQPISAHEGDELAERRHDAQQRPQHRAARHDHVTHGAAEVEGHRSGGCGVCLSQRVALPLSVSLLPLPRLDSTS